VPLESDKGALGPRALVGICANRHVFNKEATAEFTKQKDEAQCPRCNANVYCFDEVPLERKLSRPFFFTFQWVHRDIFVLGPNLAHFVVGLIFYGAALLPTLLLYYFFEDLPADPAKIDWNLGSILAPIFFAVCALLFWVLALAHSWPTYMTYFLFNRSRARLSFFAPWYSSYSLGDVLGLQICAGSYGIIEGSECPTYQLNLALKDELAPRKNAIDQEPSLLDIKKCARQMANFLDVPVIYNHQAG
jgi:hypothetical protein